VIIRTAQMEALNAVPSRVFEDEMVAHLAEFSPPLFRAVKEAQMREVIRFGTASAARHGIVLRGPVRLYLELMLLFGSHFDTDPQYPWAAEILSDPDAVSEMQRAERLYDKTCDYRDTVIGPDDVYALAALRNISTFAREPLPAAFDGLAPSMLAEMARVYPQKVAYVGEPGLQRLIDQGLGIAHRHGFSSARARALPSVLMFAFGHGCFADPLYPWVGTTMEDTAIVGPEARARRLEHKALTWLDQVLQHLADSPTS
jgi:hypothetical protein